MKVIATTGTLAANGDFIVQMSRSEMMRVLGESYLPDEKLPRIGAEVRLVKAWDIVTYVRERPAKLDALLVSVKAIEKAVAVAIDDISSPLILEA